MKLLSSFVNPSSQELRQSVEHLETSHPQLARAFVTRYSIRIPPTRLVPIRSAVFRLLCQADEDDMTIQLGALQRRDPFHDCLEARMVAEALEIRVMLDPVSHCDTCLN